MGRVSDETKSLSASVDGDRASVSVTRYRRGECDTDWHAHDRFQVAFVFEGTGDSLSRRGLPLRGDGVWTYPAGALHRWVPRTATSRSLNVELSEDFLAEAGCTEGKALERIVHGGDLKIRLARIAREMALGDGDTEAALASLLLCLVTGEQRGRSEGRPRWVGIVEEYLNDHWNEPLGLADLAREAGVHRVTISRSFRRHFGVTLGEHRRRRKIERSVPLVTGTERGLAEVALACGFADQSHLTRTFGAVVGATPNALRRRLRSG